MQFKGTKGNIKAPCGTVSDTNQCLPNNCLYIGKTQIAKIFGLTIEEATANTIIFKHSRLMLEMLIKTNESLLQDSLSRDQIKLREEIEKLIKKATTI